MKFLDNSGHIFSLTSYDVEPIGYEYDDVPYVFWINDNNDNTNLSINNYYARVINILYEVDMDINENVNIDDFLNIDITIDSNIFGFIPANLLQKQVLLGNIKNIYTDYFDIQHSNIVKHLTNTLDDSEHDDDFICIKVIEDNKYYIIIPLYVIGYVTEPGNWTSTALIHISYKNDTLKHEWCPITIGGNFIDKYETLYIHGRNMGVDLPEDILRAVNGVSFFNDNFDEEKYNIKLKEYMLNYMGIKGERGNYNSIIQSIKWFGYNNIINIYKLIKTDNEFKTQFIRDYFDIYIDILDSYKYFVTSQYISISVPLNVETGEHYEQHISKDNKLWGEGLPILDDLVNKNILKTTDELLPTQQYNYVDTYFGYSLTELGLKIAAMKYYLDKYFLPIFIKIKSCAMEYKVYQNDIKFISKARTLVNAGYYTVFDVDNEIEFTDEEIYYFTHQYHYVDDLLNEFNILHALDNEIIYKDEHKLTADNIYNNQESEWYIINDTCVSIPIKFKYNKYYNCVLMLFDENGCIYETRFSFVQNDDYQYKNFILYPKLIENLQHKSLHDCINKKYRLCLLVNNKWYDKIFTLKISALKADFGILEYKYYSNDLNYLYYIHQQNIKNNDENFEENIYFDFVGKGNPVNITQYISDYDFFDMPSKFVSNFRQIKELTDDKIVFNKYMHNNELVSTNNLLFDIYDKDSVMFENLISSYKDKLYIQQNDAYLNHIILYDLLQKDIETVEIPIFSQNFRVWVDGLLFTKNGLQSPIYINGSTNSDISTKDGIDYYLSEQNFNLHGSRRSDGNPFAETTENGHTGVGRFGLNEHSVYMYYLKRDNMYNILPEYDTTDYSYFINKNEFTECGEIIFSDFEGFKTFTKIVYNNAPKIKFDTNTSKYYTNDISQNNVEYKLEFVKYNDTTEEYERFDTNAYDWLYDKSSILIRAKFIEYSYLKILNYVGYYTDNEVDGIKCSNISEDESTCTLQINDTIIENVPLIKTSYYHYTSHSGEVYKYNPSFWVAISGDEYDDYNSIINKLNSIQDTFNHNSNIDSHFPKYYNILCKDLTGNSGNYEIVLKDNNNENVNICVSINGEEINGNKFSLTGNEQSVLIYLKTTNSDFDNVEINPILYKYETVYKQKPFIERAFSENDYNNSEQAKLYNEFYSKKYEIYSINQNEEKTSLINVYETNIPFNNIEFYDTYLMHDSEHWYIIQISKMTILDLATSYPEYKNINQDIIFNNETYKIHYVKSDKRFLINRMKYISNNGINHFNQKDIIVAKLENNDMLPIDVYYNTKWKVTPLSIGMLNKDVNIYSSTNAAILSIPKDNNQYAKGYYDVQINYSLSHNDAYKQEIKTRILVK